MNKHDFISELKTEHIDFLTDLLKRSLLFYLNNKGKEVTVELPEDECYSPSGESTERFMTLYPTSDIDRGIEVVISLLQANELLIKCFEGKYGGENNER